MMTLWEVATELSRRLTRIFLRDDRRPAPGVRRRRTVSDRSALARSGPFYEYFHGDTGAGVGASHQTGWTALVAKLLQQSGERSDDEVAERVPDLMQTILAVKPK